ncbi:MAG TPA: aspartate 1-decarboxylase, partial [Clostridia bacterium]|nr:aspartate 1-decarboxylase [Clostridia bacterium]
MLVHLLKSKIHRAYVTAANVAYEGSMAIDRDLMD